MSSRFTAMDVEKQEFKRSMRGFDADDVRLYLRSVAEEIERLNLENGDFREEIGRLRRDNEEFKSREATLQQTLVSAQRMTDEMTEKSKASADLLLREARMKSERVLQETQDQLARLEAEISRCKLQRDLFENRLRGTVEEHLTLLDRRLGERDEPDRLRLVRRRNDSEVG